MYFTLCDRCDRCDRCAVGYGHNFRLCISPNMPSACVASFAISNYCLHFLFRAQNSDDQLQEQLNSCEKEAVTEHSIAGEVSMQATVWKEQCQVCWTSDCIYIHVLLVYYSIMFMYVYASDVHRCLHTLRLLLIAGTNFSEFSGNP